MSWPAVQPSRLSLVPEMYCLIKVRSTILSARAIKKIPCVLTVETRFQRCRRLARHVRHRSVLMHTTVWEPFMKSLLQTRRTRICARELNFWLHLSYSKAIGNQRSKFSASLCSYWHTDFSTLFHLYLNLDNWTLWLLCPFPILTGKMPKQRSAWRIW